MRRAVRWAMGLYPRAWRKRYAREFEALLEDVQPGGRELWDVVAGGLKMQMFTWTWRKTAAAFALAGATVAGVVAVRTPNVYVSTAVMRIAARPESYRWLALAQQDVLSRTSLAEIIQHRGLYPEERKNLPLEDIVQSMRNQRIRIMPVSDGAFSVSFQYPDRGLAQQVTKDLTSRMLEATKSGRVAMTLEVLDAASLPEAPASPNRPAIIGVGLAVGLTLGFLFLGVRRWPMAATCGAAAALAALAISFLIPDRYISTAVMQLDAGADTRQLIADTLTDKTLSDIIQRVDLDAYKKTPEADAIQRMRNRDIRVKVLRGRTPGVTAFAISFEANDRYKAQAGVRMLVTRMTVQNVMEVRQHPDHPVRGFNLVVLDPASLPERPADPNRLAILLLGLCAGVIGGIFLMRFRRPKALAAGAA